MKKPILLLLIISFVSGCRKDETDVPSVLTGNWLWASSIGGFAGVTYNVEPGEQIILRFDESGKLTITRSDTVFFSSDYTIKKAATGEEYVLDISNQKRYNGPIRKFVPIPFGDMSMTVRQNKLTMYDIEITDGWSHSFVR